MRRAFPAVLRRGFVVGGEAPLQQLKIYRLVAKGLKSKCVSTVGDREVISDTPVDMGGNDDGPQPVEYLLAALVGCKTATATFVARHMRPRLSLQSVDFEVEASRDQRGSLYLPMGKHTHARPAKPFSMNMDVEVPPVSRLQSISGTAWVTTSASQEQVDLLAAEVERRCPVANMVMLSGCKLDIQWIKVSTPTPTPTSPA
jgi:uncharacterized OsmC-like protein